MTHQQLTLLDAPTHTPSTQWEYENQDTCHHQWLRSSDHHGLFCWRCYHCRQTQPADRIRDRAEILAFANKQEEKFLTFITRLIMAKTKKDETIVINCSSQYYWRAKLSYLMVGKKMQDEWGDFEAQAPCPPELLPIFEILTQQSPLNDLGKKAQDSQFKGLFLFRGEGNI